MTRARGLATPPHTSFSSFPLTPFDLAICQHWGLLWCRCVFLTVVSKPSFGAPYWLAPRWAWVIPAVVVFFFPWEMDPYYSLISLSWEMDPYCQILSLSLSLSLSRSPLSLIQWLVVSQSCMLIYIYIYITFFITFLSVLMLWKFCLLFFIFLFFWSSPAVAKAVDNKYNTNTSSSWTRGGSACYAETLRGLDGGGDSTLRC